MAMKYAGFGIKEMARSALKPLQVMQIQKYIQDITTADVERGPAGVRAQAMSKDGLFIVNTVLFLLNTLITGLLSDYVISFQVL